MEISFIIRLTVHSILLYLISYLCGLLIIHKNIKINYTRKIIHFFAFFVPMILATFITYKETTLTTIISFIVSISSFALYTKPFRSRFSFFNTSFLAFDRPEDRPNTLLWMTTQYIAGWIAMIPMIVYLGSIGKMELMFIPVLINGIGDGLAEPVGIRFGKRKYKVNAIFSKQKYERSIEGSMCVFIVSIITIALFRAYFTQIQFIFAIILIPILMTLAEAKSPHTWDLPVLYLTAGISLIGILHI